VHVDEINLSTALIKVPSWSRFIQILSETTKRADDYDKFQLTAAEWGVEATGMHMDCMCRDGMTLAAVDLHPPLFIPFTLVN